MPISRTPTLLPYALVLAVLLAAFPVLAGAAFVSGTEDVPLMAGLAEQGEGALEFDTAEGRIVQVTARGGPSADAVRAFYKETLPQLGWTTAGADLWRREGEELRLEFPAPGAVRFILAPVAGR